MLHTGMGTFDCPSRCDEFCKDHDFSEKLLGTLLYHPFLTPAEKTLVKTYPKQAISVYKAKQMAKKATERKFHRNDQSKSRNGLGQQSCGIVGGRQTFKRWQAESGRNRESSFERTQA